MPEITLTDAEREKLVAAVHAERGWDSFAHHLNGAEIGHLVSLALSAVPRLALASPMVGELVALAREAVAYIEKVERYDYAEKVKADPDWMGEYMPEFCPSEELDALRVKLAALTGEEGRDAE